MNKLCLSSMVCAAALSVATVAGCPGEGRNCHAVGCGPSRYQLGSEAWPAGEYKVVIAYEQSEPVEVSCSFRIDADFMGGTDDAGVEYEPPTAECLQTTGGRVSVASSDRASLEMFDSPASFELSIERDGREVFSETITPGYQSAEINGPGCGVCSNASENIEVGALQ